MKETERKAYLAAMGIDIYCPRKFSPELKESSFNNSEKTKSKENNLGRVAASVESQSSNYTSDPEAKTKKHKVSREKKHSSKVIEPEAISHENELSFSINFYHINESLAVIDDFPIQQSATAKAQSLNLLINIVKALDIDVDLRELREEKLTWPLAEGLTSLKDEISAARMMMLGFIERKSEQKAFKNLLVFAGVIEGLLVSPEKIADNRDYLHHSNNFYVTVTHSLQSMLSLPELKKDVWNQVQPLKERIKVS